MVQPARHIYQKPYTENFYGTLHMSVNKNQQQTRKPLVIVERAVNGQVTAQQVIDLIIARGLQFYEFSTAGSGCLHWQLTFIDKLVERDWVSAALPRGVHESIEKVRKVKENAGLIKYPPVEGLYYTPGPGA